MDSAKPFKVLLEMMKEKYASIAGGSNDLFSDEGLNAQTRMIDLYIENKQYQQAITLARELIVTKVCILHQLHCIDGREEAEGILNMVVTNSLQENVESFADIWCTLGNLRNDINHAGMRKNPIPASSLIAQIKDICTRISHRISAVQI
jgi:hypothetical protein